MTLILAGVYARQSLVTPLKRASKNRCIADDKLPITNPGSGQITSGLRTSARSHSASIGGQRSCVNLNTAPIAAVHQSR